MSKFYITNNPDIAKTIKTNIQNSDFELSFVTENPSVYAYSTQKLKYANCNYSKDGDNFVVATGSLIYDGLLEYSNILNDFKSVSQIRERSIGQYGVVLCKDNKICIWGDPVGVYDIFYYNKDNTYVVSNSLFDMACSIPELTLDELNFIELNAQNGILLNETIYCEIKRLSGDQYIYINNTSFELFDLKNTYEDKFSDFDCLVAETTNRIKEKAQAIKKVLGDPSIFMTGGLDARLCLAAFMSIGCKPLLYFGEENYFLPDSNINENDKHVDVLLSKKHGLRLSVQDWSNPKQINQDWNYCIYRYGFNGYVYGGSKKVMNCFENIESNYSTLGYFGELYRNLEWIEDRKDRTMSINDFLDEYYLNRNDADITRNVIGYREHLYHKIEQICKKYNLNPNGFDKKDTIYFDLEYRKVADTRMINLLNRSKYSFSVLMEKDVLNCIFADIEFKRASRFQVGLIYHLYAELLDSPIFTHGRYRDVNKSTLLLGRPYDGGNKYLQKFKSAIRYFIRYIIPSQYRKKILDIKYDLNKSEDESPLGLFIHECADKYPDIRGISFKKRRLMGRRLLPRYFQFIDALRLTKKTNI